MDSNDDEDSWVLVEKFSEANSNEAADAARYSLSQHRPRQALQAVGESAQWYSLNILSKANARLKGAISLNNVSYCLLNRSTIDKVEEILAREDAQVNSSISAQNAGSAERRELEQYSSSITQALYTTFHESTVLPCHCQGQGRRLCILDGHVCALQLDGKWDLSGDESHCFFDSVVAVDQNYQWQQIQFQIPRIISQVRFEDSTDDANGKTPDPTYELLDDFCRIVESRVRYHRIPLRIEGSIPSHKLYKLDPVFINDCPEDRAPIPLSMALRENLLSTRSKIHLAFTLSKSFWQYYESDWMRAAWNFETVHLLPQSVDSAIVTLNPEAQMPFLTIDAIAPGEPSFHEYEPRDPSSGAKRMHCYPYILNLCLLLVLLCTKAGSPPAPLTSMDEIYCYCARETKRKQSIWPVIDLADEHKQKYRSIVAHCLPQPCKAICLSLAERRAMLRDNVVRPLHDLLQGLQGLDMDAEIDDAPATEVAPGLQIHSGVSGGVDKVGQTPSEESRTWINNIKDSSLSRYLLQTLKNDKRERKPKVAIIDTGYDGKARWLSHVFRMRLGQREGQISQNWKDFWESKDQPQDDFGHGTSMLYTIMHIAPFADVCVARIAGNSDHLREESSRTSKNLAEAIHWAAEVQKADIISMSFGWKQEKLFEEHPVVSNAISDALRNRDQQVLFFAAASNYGGGRDELFPAKHPQVFSIRATNTLGNHEDFNPPLPQNGGAVFGTLGVGVPTQERTSRTGTSVATAVAAGIAAIIVGYINIHGKEGFWDGLRTHGGFERLLLHHNISTEPEARKRFITLERLYGEHWQRDFESCLNSTTL